MNNNYKAVLILGCIGLIANPVFAAGDFVLEEVIVTAQKRSQDIVDVPFSITAMSGEKMEVLGVQNFADYSRSVPGLDFQDLGPSGARGVRLAAVRGIYGGGTSNTTAFYINDISVPLLDPGVFSLERIEVLKGPQGTLWGAGAMGGVIKLVTKRADAMQDDPTGSVKAELSETRFGALNNNFGGDINVPISESLAFAATGSYRKDAGYIDNVTTITQSYLDPSSAVAKENANDSELIDIFAELRWTPNGNLEIAPSLFYHDGSVDHLGASNEALLNLQSNFEAPTDSEEEYWILGLPISVDFGGVELVSVSSYFDYEANANEDSTEGNTGVFNAFFDADLREIFPGNSFTSFQQNHRKQQIFTQEIRLSNTDTTTLDWTVGLYYSNSELDVTGDEIAVNSDDYRTLVNTFFDGAPPLINALGANGNQLVLQQNSTETEEIATFANLTWHLADRWSLTGGLRLFDINSDFTLARGPDFFATFFQNISSSFAESDYSDTGITYKASTSFDLNDDVNAFVSYSTGYRPGGSNFLSQEVATSCGYSADFDSDDIENIELGLKGTFVDGRVYASAAIFYTKWSDIQQQVRNLDSGCGTGATENFGDAEIMGGEFELTAQATEYLSAGMTASYTDTEFTTPNPALGIDKGDPIPLISEWQFSTYGQVDFTISNEIEGFVRADFQYSDGAQLDYVLSNFIGEPFANEKDAYRNWGASIGAYIGDGWEAKLFARNLTDERPVIGSRVGGQTNDRRVLTLRPRTIGVSVSKEF